MGAIGHGLYVALLLVWSADPMPAEISVGERDDDTGVITHTVRSPLQSAPTDIRVLLPARFDPKRRYRVVYVLPVEAGRESRYGDGLAEIRRQKLHERYPAVFVAPTFARLPWYADHSESADLRQESYFLQVVVPFVRKSYAVEDRPHLLGFSKSGWGAWSLLLRNPKTFGRAAAWDAPLMMERPDRYGMGEIFGTQANFERYQISRLLGQAGKDLGKEPRLILTGYGNFREHHQQAHELLDKLQIPHVYRDGPMRKHDWHSGWVGEAVAEPLRGEPPGDIGNGEATAGSKVGGPGGPPYGLPADCVETETATSVVVGPGGPTSKSPADCGAG